MKVKNFIISFNKSFSYWKPTKIFSFLQSVKSCSIKLKLDQMFDLTILFNRLRSLKCFGNSIESPGRLSLFKSSFKIKVFQLICYPKTLFLIILKETSIRLTIFINIKTKSFFLTPLKSPFENRIINQRFGLLLVINDSLLSKLMFFGFPFGIAYGI